jgi:hypothetical protein
MVVLGVGLAGGVAVAAAVFLALPALLGGQGGLWESLETMAICQTRDAELQERCVALRQAIKAKQGIINDLLAGKSNLAEAMGQFRQAMSITDEDAPSVGDEKVFSSIVDWTHATLVDNPPRFQAALRALHQQRARLVAAGEYSI